MLSRSWKGVPKLDTHDEAGICGAEMKVGMQVPNAIRCELRRNHTGHHRNRLTTWARTPEEMREYLNQAQENKE
jgi:hypothetical protein